MDACIAGNMISARKPLLLGACHKGLQLTFKNSPCQLLAHGKLVLGRQRTLFSTARSVAMRTFPRDRFEEEIEVYSKDDLEVATENWSNHIAYGGTGAVFKGDIKGTPVAIKAFYKDKEGKIRFQNEFDQEILLLSSIKHKNIIKLLGVCFDGCLVYECLDLSLEHRLSKKFKGPAIPWKRRLKIAYDVAAGILFIHECGCVHRDIKPANVLLSNDFDCCKLCDFGFAVGIWDKAIDVKGTHGYMDPFYKENKILGKYIDIYSVGVTFLQLVTGITDAQYIDLEEIGKNMRTEFASSVLDRSASDWPRGNAVRFANLASMCMGMERLEHPEFLRHEVLPTLEELMEYEGKTWN